MKKTRFGLVVIALALLMSNNIFAQVNFDVPQNIKLKSDNDYAKYEPDIIAAAKWLEQTDLNVETKKRKEINAFVSQWIVGTPVVSVRLSEHLQGIYDKNAELLLIYIASFSSYYLIHKKDATEFEATKAGLMSIMYVYKKGIEIKKSKEMDKLIKLTNENKLDDYINEKFKLTDARFDD